MACDAADDLEEAELRLCRTNLDAPRLGRLPRRMTRKNRSLIVAALIFVAVWTVVLVGLFPGSDAVGLGLVVSASVLAGAVARDWRILVVALAVIPLFALLWCKEGPTTYCEINPAGYAAAFVVPPTMALLAIGVWLRKAIERIRHRAASV